MSLNEKDLVWFHYHPPSETFDLMVTYDQDDPEVPNGLWLSTKGKDDSWDTWRFSVDPKNEPLAEDLKACDKITLFPDTKIFETAYSPTSNPYEQLIADGYDGILYRKSEGDHGNFITSLCLWNLDKIESVEELVMDDT